MIFLAFLLPLALYLLLVGSFHRRTTPLLLSGTWDFVSLLFAVSGFLLFTGPVFITSLSQRWRNFWLFGAAPPGDAMEYTWYFLATCYFTLVVGGSAYRFWRVGGQTAIYNITPEQLHEALDTTSGHLGLNLLRTGDIYLFEDAPPADHSSSKITAIQTSPGSIEMTTLAPAAHSVPAEGVMLKVDAFAALRHVTLIWDPSTPPVRREFEAELRRVLADSPTAPSDLGGVLFLLGTMLLALTMVGTVALLLVRILVPA